MRYAEFDEHPRDEKWHDIVVRPMEVGDIAAVSAVFAEREDVSPSRAANVVSRWVESDRSRLVLVATRQDQMLGYGKAEWLDPVEQGGSAPTGWYLTGLVVTPSARRHGVGGRLTEQRIATLSATANEVWYFANVRNQTTIAVHERHGFVLYTYEFEIPGVTFDGGRGALFRLPLVHR